MRLFCIIALMLIPFSVLAQDVAVIVHETNLNTLDQKQLSLIFLNRIESFPDGTPAYPVAKKCSTDAGVTFNKKILGKSKAQFKSYWAKLSFTGRGEQPKEYRTDREILNIVRNNPIAIGFINLESVEDIEPEGIRVVLVLRQ